MLHLHFARLDTITHLSSRISLQLIIHTRTPCPHHDTLSHTCSSLYVYVREESALDERRSLAQRFSYGNAQEWSPRRRSRQAKLFNAFDISTFFFSRQLSVSLAPRSVEIERETFSRVASVFIFERNPKMCLTRRSELRANHMCVRNQFERSWDRFDEILTRRRAFPHLLSRRLAAEPRRRCHAHN